MDGLEKEREREKEKNGIYMNKVKIENTKLSLVINKLF